LRRKRLFYSVKPVEIINALDAVIAILDEYSIPNMSGGNYTLYKTKEGNWDDIPETNKETNRTVLLALNWLSIHFER